MNTVPNPIVDSIRLIGCATTVLLIMVSAAVAQDVPPDVAEFGGVAGDRHDGQRHVVQPSQAPIDMIQRKLQAASERYARLAAGLEQRDPGAEAAAAENLRILREELQRLIDELPEDAEAPIIPAPGTENPDPKTPSSASPLSPVEPAESPVGPENESKTPAEPARSETDIDTNGDQDDHGEAIDSATALSHPTSAVGVDEDTPFDAARLLKLAERLEDEAEQLRQHAQHLHHRHRLDAEQQRRVEKLEDVIGAKETRVD